jgi:VWFA-related protein
VTSTSILRVVLPSTARKFLCGILLHVFCLSCALVCTAKSDAQATAPPQSAPAPEAGTSTPSVQSASSPPASNPAQEISSRDELTTFKVKVNLVLVRVVVRDASGKAIGNLRQEDFDLFDDRKPQVIKQFSVEQPGNKAASQQTQPKPEEDSGETLPPPVAPEHYVAYIFDDVHLEFGDLARVRDAADHHMATLATTDRAAIFTTSGQNNLDFTDDRTKLHDTLQQLRPRPISRGGGTGCPDISFYMADLIQNRRDPTAIQLATEDALACAFNRDRRMLSAAQAMAESTASGVLNQGDHESRVTLSVLRDAIRRVAVMPGQRTILLLSPGFLTPQMESDYLELVDHALRSQVIISSLNGRGLYTVDPLGDISKEGPANEFASVSRAQYASQSASAEEDILRDLAFGTGGSFFHNSNDLDEGFRYIAAAPEYWYVLGFSPQNLKLDGRFHGLKVTVKNRQKLTILARKGYYAPKHVADPAEEAKQEIEDALFSQEELHDLPIDLRTQFFKPSDLDAKLAVLVHVDVKRMHFRKAEGRNQNNLTIVSGLFDRNGKFITGNQKVLDMHLKDETLANKLGSGITVKSSFDVKPGSYLVRLVVRDAEGQLSAANGAIEIP